MISGYEDDKSFPFETSCIEKKNLWSVRHSEPLACGTIIASLVKGGLKGLFPFGESIEFDRCCLLGNPLLLWERKKGRTGRQHAVLSRFV